MYTKTLTLNNGVKIPQLGLGTWFIDDSNAAEAVKAAATHFTEVRDTQVSCRQR